DRQLAVAQAGCALLDAEKSQGSSLNSREMESLRRWCAARIHDRAYRSWVIFRFPETLDYFNLVDVQRPDQARPETMFGPDWRLRRRDGFRLTDPRFTVREVLSEIYYCVLCHERDKESCSQSLQVKDGKVSANDRRINVIVCA